MALEEQSPNIASGVHVGRSDDDVGAGDQVIGREVHGRNVIGREMRTSVPC